MSRDLVLSSVWFLSICIARCLGNKICGRIRHLLLGYCRYFDFGRIL